MKNYFLLSLALCLSFFSLTTLSKDPAPKIKVLEDKQEIVKDIRKVLDTLHTILPESHSLDIKEGQSFTPRDLHSLLLSALGLLNAHHEEIPDDEVVQELVKNITKLSSRLTTIKANSIIVYQTEPSGIVVNTGDIDINYATAFKVVRKKIDCFRTIKPDSMFQIAAKTGATTINTASQSDTATALTIFAGPQATAIDINNGTIVISGDGSITTTGSISASNFSSTTQTFTDLTVTNDVTVGNNLDVAGTLTAATFSVTDLSVPGTISINGAARFIDDNSNYIGITAPSTVTTSYTVTLPSSSPTAGQVLTANSTTPTTLEWSNVGGNILPSSSRVVYVSKAGSSTGNGSLTFPYNTIKDGIARANALSTTTNPVIVYISPGLYVEDNSVGALSITAGGISLVGESASAVLIQPSTLANDLLSVNQGTRFFNITFRSGLPVGSTSAGTGLTLNASSSSLYNLTVSGFNIGVFCTGSSTSNFLRSCIISSNATGLRINNVLAFADNCTIAGVSSGSPANTGVSITGGSGQLFATGGLYSNCATCIAINTSGLLTVESVSFRTNVIGINALSGAQVIVQGSSFTTNVTSGTVTNIQGAGSGTRLGITGCIFSQSPVLANTLNAIKISDEASCSIAGGEVSRYTTALSVEGTNTSELIASSFIIGDCTNDIVQAGTSTLNFNGTATSTKITIADATNVTVAFFDPVNNNTLNIGKFDDVYMKIIGAAVGTSIENPQIDYHPSIYSTQALGYFNVLGNPATWYSLSSDDSEFASITSNRDKTAGLRMVSDTGADIGTTLSLRGWNIEKQATSAELAFQFSNTDLTGPQPAVTEYSLMMLDGFNNQLLLPTSGTHIVFTSDASANLYRATTATLQTDGNLRIGGLTASRAVVTDANKQLASSATTATEVGYLNGVTSSIQTQLDAKLATTGGTLSGALRIPAGSAAAPSLNFTGSTTTGLYASTADTLGMSTGGTERFVISSSGALTVPNLALLNGVVKTDASGNLTAGLVSNANIASDAAITDSKLATISTAGKVTNTAVQAVSTNTLGRIVARDAVDGGFSAGTITATFVGDLTGNADTATSATSATTATNATNFTGSLVGDVTGTQGATVVDTVGGVSAANVASGATAANNAVSAATANRIVLRDGSGDFSTHMITITGTPTANTDVATKAYVDTAGFIEPHEPVVAVSVANIASLSGPTTIDSVAVVAGNRVLLTAQTDGVENGIWVVDAGAWARPADFLNGSSAANVSVFVTDGTVYAGSGWICTNIAGSDIVGTDALTFVQYTAASTVAAANVGTGDGQLYRNTTAGPTLNFRTLNEGSFITIDTDVTLTNTVTIAANGSTTGVSNLIARDSSGNFTANIMTGTASNNVLKAGDTMTGTLNMATQSEIRWQDAAGGQYIGLQAPATVGSSYTVSLPSAAPTTGQVLQATSTSATQWGTIGSGVTGFTYYVSKGGSDANDGSFASPFLTVGHAVDVANGIASTTTPVAIRVGAGIFEESAPISITASGISIIGNSIGSTTLREATASDNLFEIGDVTNIEIINCSLDAVVTTAPADNGVAITMNTATTGMNYFAHCQITGFSKGFSLTSTANDPVMQLNNLVLFNNALGVEFNAVRAFIRNTAFLGPNIGIDTAAHTGVHCSGGLVTFLSNSYRLLTNALVFDTQANVRVVGATFESCTNGVTASDGSICTIDGGSFVNNNASSVNVSSAGVGTVIDIGGTDFRASSSSLTPAGIVLRATTGGNIIIGGCTIENAVTAIQCGATDNTDTSTTDITASSVIITGCTNDIAQYGTTSLKINGSTFSSTKVSINDSTNVSTAFFDAAGDFELCVGKFDTVDTVLLEAQIGMGHPMPGLDYKNSIYNSPSIFVHNHLDTSFSTGIITANDSAVNVVTTAVGNTANVTFFSDGGTPHGGTSALRGWNITKNTGTAELAFQFRNNIAPATTVAQYTVMQLDGFNNQVQLPTSGTHLVFGGDASANLYRATTATLQTDGNVRIGGLTASRAVVTDANKQLTSSATSATEIGYVQGVTSSIQTQLDSKFATSGGTLSGNLTVPAGTASAPSLNFTGSTTTGFSAPLGTLTLSTAGVSRLTVSSGGSIAIPAFTTANGVVQTNASGVLSSALLVDANIDPAAAIQDTKLATIQTTGKVSNSATTATSANTASAIVARDGNGAFAASSATFAPSTNVSALTVTGSSATSATAAALRITGSSGTTPTADILSIAAGTTTGNAINIASGTMTVATNSDIKVTPATATAASNPTNFTMNRRFGQIEWTLATNMSNGAIASGTCTNTTVTASSVIMATTTSSVTNTLTAPIVITPANGSFNFTIRNVGATINVGQTITFTFWVLS